jgi:ribosome-associated protein
MTAMLIVDDRISVPDDEFVIEFSRSGGPGGQNVNKVNSKAQVRWNPGRSASLPDDVRSRFLKLIAARLTVDGDLLITSQRTRDQSRNVEDCFEKLRLLLLASSRPPKSRRPSRPTHASKLRRLEQKQQRSTTKELRKKPRLD